MALKILISKNFLKNLKQKIPKIFTKKILNYENVNWIMKILTGL